jgi:hypothetical protein
VAARDDASAKPQSRHQSHHDDEHADSGCRDTQPTMDPGPTRGHQTRLGGEQHKPSRHHDSVNHHVSGYGAASVQARRYSVGLKPATTIASRSHDMAEKNLPGTRCCVAALRIVAADKAAEKVLFTLSPQGIQRPRHARLIPRAGHTHV